VQLLKNFPAFYGMRRFITVFTRALHWSLSWARSIQSIRPHHISLSTIFILSTHLRLGLLVISFLLTFPPISCMHYSSTHSCYMPNESHPPWLDNSNYTLRRVQIMKPLIMQFSPNSCHFISLRSKYSPQHPVLKHPMFLSLGRLCRESAQIRGPLWHFVTSLFFMAKSC
jgi:hypothetical protein